MLKALGGDIPEALEILTGAARPILERWFESEPLRATLATDAVIGAFASISAPGTAYVLLHHVMGTAGGARGVWGYVQGGMGGLALSLERACETCRSTCAAKRKSAEFWSPRAGDGRRIERRHATRRSRRRLDRGCTPDVRTISGRQRIARRFPERRQAHRLLVGVREDQSGLVRTSQFHGAASQGVAPHHHGTMHISPTLDYIDRAYDDAKYGQPSREPVLEMTMPTSVDDTIAPPGQHRLDLRAVRTLQAGRRQLGRHQGVLRGPLHRADRRGTHRTCPERILHRQVLSPLDLERTFGLTGGNIMQGAMNFQPAVLPPARAGLGRSSHAHSGLYLCGAASIPAAA